MNTPTLSPQEAQDHAVFMALMWAMSRPGEVQTFEARTEARLRESTEFSGTLPGGTSLWPGGENALEAVGKALLDLETSFYSPDPTLHQTFIRLGAWAESPEKAAYQFYTVMDEAALESISRASVGTLLFPEQAAAIVVIAEMNNGSRLRLRGPGIKNFNEVQVELPNHFWSLRNERVSYPLGWDVLILFPSPARGVGAEELEQVIAIPRSVQLEVI